MNPSKHESGANLFKKVVAISRGASSGGQASGTRRTSAFGLDMQQESPPEVVVCVWEVPQFKDRLEEMRDLYEVFRSDGRADFDQRIAEPGSDPWQDYSFVEVQSLLQLTSFQNEEKWRNSNKSQRRIAATGTGLFKGDEQGALSPNAASSWGGAFVDSVLLAAQAAELASKRQCAELEVVVEDLQSKLALKEAQLEEQRQQSLQKDKRLAELEAELALVPSSVAPKGVRLFRRAGDPTVVIDREAAFHEEVHGILTQIREQAPRNWDQLCELRAQLRSSQKAFEAMGEGFIRNWDERREAKKRQAVEDDAGSRPMGRRPIDLDADSVGSAPAAQGDGILRPGGAAPERRPPENGLLPAVSFRPPAEDETFNPSGRWGSHESLSTGMSAQSSRRFSDASDATECSAFSVQRSDATDASETW